MTPLHLLLLALPLASAAHSDLSTPLGAATAPRSWDTAYTLASSALSQLSAADKIALTTGTGVGFGPCSGNVKALPKINFPWLCLNDGPTALRGADLVTVFPAGVTTGATWDKELMYLRSRAMGREAKTKGVNVLLSPVAGALGRAPDAGRGWEGFGSDPYLAGRGGAESVRGLQDEGVVATVKHWIGNEQEHYRLVLEHLVNGKPILQSLSSEIDERTMKELYEWPFLDAVDAGVGAVMCAYQRVNGKYSCESEEIIKGSLKANSTSGGLAFRGFVMTDWFAVSAPHLSAPAGIDMIMPGDLGLMGAVAALQKASDGALTNGTRLDEAAIRILAAWYKLRQETDFPKASFSSWKPDSENGVFLDRAYAGQINFHVPANPPLHAQIARRIAAEGATLLKNSGAALPLGSEKRIAVFGSDAGPVPADSCGTYDSCSNGTLAMGWGSGSGTFETLIDPLQAITEHASTVGAKVDSVLNDFDYTSIRSKAADNQDVCLAFINSRSGEATNTVEGNFGDRNNLTAWHAGDTLVQTVAANCANTVVVIHSVGAILTEPWINHPNVTAVLLAHLPGQESGSSLVDVLWGATNPSGKLPYTIAKQQSDYCCSVKKEWSGFSPTQTFSEGLLIDYKHFDTNNITPRFEFGFGLSYTEFTYAQTLSVEKTVENVAAASAFETMVTVTTEIENVGEVKGKETAQLYIEFPAGVPKGTPVRQLRGFEKVELAPGEKKTVSFEVRKRDLSYWNVAEKKWVVPSGEFGVVVGRSSRKFEGRGKVSVV